VEVLCPFTKRMLHTLVWPRDVAVERHRDVESKSAHRVLLSFNRASV
jgi:hypothetical protein